MFTDKVERNFHFPAPGWNRMTHRQALHDFPDTIQVPLHKHDKNKVTANSSSFWKQGSGNYV
jgi:hypothetical protein